MAEQNVQNVPLEHQDRQQNKSLLISKIKGLMGIPNPEPNPNEENLITMECINETIRQKHSLKETWKRANYKECCCSIVCFCCCCSKENRNNDTLKKQEKEIETYPELISQNIQKKDLFCCNYQFFFLCVFGFLHFIAISQVNSIAYSLFGEVKRSLLKHLNNKISWINMKLTNKSFLTFLKNSNSDDSSQINLFYFSSLFTPKLLSNLKMKKLYCFCIIINVVTVIFLFLFEFLTEEEIKSDKNYSFPYLLLRLILSLICLYLNTGLIALLPYKMLELNEYYKQKEYSWHLNLLILLSIITKIFVNSLIKCNTINDYLWCCLGIFGISSIIFFYIYAVLEKSIFNQKIILIM